MNVRIKVQVQVLVSVNSCATAPLPVLEGPETDLIAENECSSAGDSKHIDVRYKFVAQAFTEGSVRVRYTPTYMNLADVLTKAVPLATFERLVTTVVRLCLESKRGEYYVKLADEKMNHVSDENTWMVTDMW